MRCDKPHVVLVKSCSVTAVIVPAQGPPWVNAYVRYVPKVSCSDHSSLHNKTEMVTGAWQGRDDYRQEMTQAELTGGDTQVPQCSLVQGAQNKP